VTSISSLALCAWPARSVYLTPEAPPKRCSRSPPAPIASHPASSSLNLILTSLLDHITFLQTQFAVFDGQIEAAAEQLPGYHHLLSNPCIGPI
jgi:hypothetical protein